MKYLMSFVVATVVGMNCYTAEAAFENVANSSLSQLSIGSVKAFGHNTLRENLFKKHQKYKITCTDYYPNGKKHMCRYYTGGRGARTTKPCGIDIAVPMGTKIYAPGAGIIRDVGFDEKGFGFHFEILHDDGTITLYGHLQYYGYVHEGKRVKKGQLIALSGNSGNSTGPHLHFEMSSWSF